MHIYNVSLHSLFKWLHVLEQLSQYSQAHACIPKQTPRTAGNTITSSQQCKHWKRNSKPGGLGDIYRMYIVYINRAGIR